MSRVNPRITYDYVALSEQIKAREGIVRDLRKKLKKGLKPVAHDGGPPIKYTPDGVSFSERMLQNIINDIAYKTSQMRAQLRKLEGKKR